MLDWEAGAWSADLFLLFDYSRPWLFLSFHFLSQVLTSSLLETLESVTKLLKRIKSKAYGVLIGIK